MEGKGKVIDIGTFITRECHSLSGKLLERVCVSLTDHLHNKGKASAVDRHPVATPCPSEFL